MIIKNIIFDLGGVLLNIDYQLTVMAFKDLGIENFEELYSQAKQTDLFDKIETGKIESNLFLRKIEKIAAKKISLTDIEKAWNALLLDLPTERISMLQKASQNYRIFLLSNTNEIHYNQYINDIRRIHEVDFNKLFEQAYYSHQIGLKKPDRKCFQYVLNKNLLKPEETLFVDDTIQHIESAKQIGIQTHYLYKNNITELFDDKGYLIS